MIWKERVNLFLLRALIVALVVVGVTADLDDAPCLAQATAARSVDLSCEDDELAFDAVDDVSLGDDAASDRDRPLPEEALACNDSFDCGLLPPRLRDNLLVNALALDRLDLSAASPPRARRESIAPLRAPRNWILVICRLAC